MYRKDAKTVSLDSKALHWATQMIDSQAAAQLPLIMRIFVLLPFEHRYRTLALRAQVLFRCLGPLLSALLSCCAYLGWMRALWSNTLIMIIIYYSSLVCYIYYSSLVCYFNNNNINIRLVTLAQQPSLLLLRFYTTVQYWFAALPYWHDQLDN